MLACPQLCAWVCLCKLIELLMGKGCLEYGILEPTDLSNMNAKLDPTDLSNMNAKLQILRV